MNSVSRGTIPYLYIARLDAYLYTMSKDKESKSDAARRQRELNWAAVQSASELKQFELPGEVEDTREPPVPAGPPPVSAEFLKREKVARKPAKRAAPRKAAESLEKKKRRRAPAYAPELAERVITLLDAGRTEKEAAEACGVTRMVAHRIKTRANRA